MDADILIVFVQDVLKLVYVWNLNVVEHRNIIFENNLVVGTQLWMDKCIVFIKVIIDSANAHI